MSHEFHDPAESDEASYKHHPMDDMEPIPNMNLYREAALKSLFVMNRAYDFMMHSDDKTVALFQSAFALGLACCEGMSMTRAAEICGVTRACISKGARRFCEINDLEPSFYMKSEEAVKTARTTREKQL